MDILTNSFRNFGDRLLEHAPEISMALLVVVLAHFIGKGLRKFYRSVLRRGELSPTHRTFFGKLLYGFSLLLGILMALNILGFYGLATSLLASGGITAVILGFAFKDIGENFLAGFFMAFSRPFRTGDLIESEGLRGRVQTIELRHTHIRTAEGCDVYIPSAQLLSKPLFNYTRDGLRRGTFTVGIDYGDDADRACRLLLEEIRKDGKVIAKPAPAVQVTGLTPTYVEVTVFFWIEVDVGLQETYMGLVRSRLMDACRRLLAEEGFTFSSGVSNALEIPELQVNLKGTA